LQDVLSQALNPDWKVELGPEASGPVHVEDAAFMGLLVTGTASGNAGLRLARGEAAAIGRAFIGEPPDPAAEFGADQREALEELLRQAFGLATTALGASFDQIWLQLDNTISLSEPSQRVPLVLTSGSVPQPMLWELWISSELADSLNHADQAPAAPAPQPAASPPPAPPEEAAPDAPPDLCRLSGVQVEITLRFGHRWLTLREISQLTSGGVVELAESVAEPVEVVIGERVIARGEIVSVDGCYGVRITETPEVVAPIR
jgi:flagellar motor switch protein FliN